MKRLFLVICCFVFTVSCLCGCENTTWSNNEKYKIEKIDDQYYLTLKSETGYPITDEEIARFGSVLFESMDEFEDALKNGKLSDNWLYVMDKHFIKIDEEGRIKLCDISNLQVPITPSEVQNLRILWLGDSYCFFMFPPGTLLTETPRGCTVFVEISEKEKFYSRYENTYCDLTARFANENYHIDKVVKHDDRDVWYYTYTNSSYSDEYKDVRYTIEKDNTKLMVEEKYWLATTNANEIGRIPSQDIPFKIEVYGIVSETEGEKYFTVKVNSPDFKPTEGWREWVSQFGIEDYVK